jgi:hypothetical protein
MRSTLPNADVIATLMRQEIDRFVEAARVRAEYDIDTRRRAMRRYHRSWPLLVSDADGITEYSAALHNASVDGIGFLCDCPLPLQGLVFIKLFWHENSALRVPAVVKHTTRCSGGILVGCQFALNDEAACRAGLRARRWFE